MEYSILLIPLMIIVVGYLMVKFPPKKINYVVGYRTLKSMKNIDNWNFANKYCGKLLMITGFIMLLISFLILILDNLKIIVVSEIVLTIITLLQIIPIIIDAIMVEVKIRKM